jgi:hypothetical protein
MPSIKTGIVAHDSACAIAESIRQTAASGASQAAIKTAEIAFYRSIISSCRANNLPFSNFSAALRDLGTDGT